MKNLPFGILYSKSPKSLFLKDALCKKFSFSKDPEVFLVLGGDGFMLRCIHKLRDKKFYGIHCGTVGFLMNVLSDINNIEKQVLGASTTTLYPLIGALKTIHEKEHTFFAINEISLLRSTPLASNLKISVNGNTRLQKCVSDGIIVSTAAGSTAYNRSLGGTIFPLESPLIALTPNNVFSPFGWKGALLESNSIINLEVLNPTKRKVSATFDFLMVQDIETIKIKQDFERPAKILFNNDDHLSERITCAQFANKIYCDT